MVSLDEAMRWALSKGMEIENARQQQYQTSKVGGTPFWDSFNNGFQSMAMIDDARNKRAWNNALKEKQAYMKQQQQPQTQPVGNAGGVSLMSPSFSDYFKQANVPQYNVGEPTFSLQSDAYGNLINNKNSFSEPTTEQAQQSVGERQLSAAPQMQQEYPNGFSMSDYQNTANASPVYKYLGDEYSLGKWMEGQSNSGVSPTMQMIKYYSQVAPLVQDARNQRMRDSIYTMQTTEENSPEWLKARAQLAVDLEKPDLRFDMDDKRFNQEIKYQNYLHQNGMWAPERLGRFGYPTDGYNNYNFGSATGGNTGSSIIDGVYEMKQKNYPFDRYDENGKKVGTNCLATFTESQGLKGTPYEGITWIPTAMEVAEKNGDWHPKGDGYKPRPGDIAIVKGGTTGEEPDGHAVMVNFDGGTIQNSRRGNGGKGGIWEDKRSPEEIHSVTGYISTSRYAKASTPQQQSPWSQLRGGIRMSPIMQYRIADAAQKRAEAAQRHADNMALRREAIANRAASKDGKGRLNLQNLNIFSNEEIDNPNSPVGRLVSGLIDVDEDGKTKLSEEELINRKTQLAEYCVPKYLNLIDQGLTENEAQSILKKELTAALGDELQAAFNGNEKQKKIQAKQAINNIYLQTVDLARQKSKYVENEEFSIINNEDEGVNGNGNNNQVTGKTLQQAQQEERERNIRNGQKYTNDQIINNPELTTGENTGIDKEFYNKLKNEGITEDLLKDEIKVWAQLLYLHPVYFMHEKAKDPENAEKARQLLIKLKNAQISDKDIKNVLSLSGDAIKHAGVGAEAFNYFFK